MSALSVRLQDLATRIATECKSIRTLVNANQATLGALNTTAKSNLVAAINELKAGLDAMSGSVTISDGTTNGTTVWSSTKVANEILAAKNSLINGSAAALDTLAEIAAALGNDANFASTMTTSLSKRLRFDAVQTLTAGEKTQACANLGIGEPDTDFVAGFNAGLL